MNSPSRIGGETSAVRPSAHPERRFLPKGWGGLADYTAPPIPLIVGETYRAWHPFTRGEYQDPFDFEDPASGGTFQMPKPHATWAPGFRFEPCGRHGEDTEEVWDGEGVQLRTIVSFHKPAHYPERVFYVRQFRDPGGKVFGKSALRIEVTFKFRRWLRGDRWPSFSPARRAHVQWAYRLANADTSEASQVPGRQP